MRRASGLRKSYGQDRADRGPLVEIILKIYQAWCTDQPGARTNLKNGKKVEGRSFPCPICAHVMIPEWGGVELEEK
jgi:hypothetical protein